MIGSDTLLLLKSIIGEYLPDPEYRVFAYGSRTKPGHRKFSDLDIGILGPAKVPPSVLIKIDNDLSDSDIPYLTSVLDFSTVSKHFRDKAMSNIINI